MCPCPKVHVLPAPCPGWGQLLAQMASPMRGLPPRLPARRREERGEEVALQPAEEPQLPESCPPASPCPPGPGGPSEGHRLLPVPAGEGTGRGQAGV